MDTSKKPHVSTELLEYLSRIFPDRCPDGDMTFQQVWSAAGSARVIRHLKSLHEAQAKAALAGE